MRLPTKEDTKNTLISLEKHGKKNKSAFFKALVRELSRPARNRAKVNLWKVNQLKEREGFKGKSLVVPGKVLAYGNLEGKIDIYALSYSEQASDKIAKAGGKPLLLNDLTEKNVKASSLVMVK